MLRFSRIRVVLALTAVGALTVLLVYRLSCTLDCQTNLSVKNSEMESEIEVDTQEKVQRHEPRNSTKNENARGTKVINPGCKKKKLNAYRAVDTGRVYEHPSIVHFIKINRYGGTSSLNFREYTSVLSVYKFLKPEKMMFHVYSNKLAGKYWDLINDWPGVKIEVNVVPEINRIGGKMVPYIQHEADYLKLKAVYKYGGLVQDFDVIIINGTRLKHQQRLSECVLSEEGEYINCGFYSCIKQSPYIARWIDSYDHDYRPQLWLHNGSFKPKDFLLEKHSDVCYNVHLDDTICIHPNWGKQREWLLKDGVNWRTKTAAHYFVKTNIPHDGEGLLNEHHSLAELIKYVHNA